VGLAPGMQAPPWYDQVGGAGVDGGSNGGDASRTRPVAAADHREADGRLPDRDSGAAAVAMTRLFTKAFQAVAFLLLAAHVAVDIHWDRWNVPRATARSRA
jgi:hypothetical protein